MVARVLRRIALAAALFGAWGTALAGESAPAGQAILCAKVLTMDDGDSSFTPGMLLLADGRIEYVGAPRPVPEGYELVEIERAWAVPGMVDLHTHIHSGGFGDINDMLRSVNPELSAAPALRPANSLIALACSGGVTTLFGIPGSGTNMSGFGILYKAKTRGGFGDAIIAAPGGLKVAQDSNPQARAGDSAFGNCRASMSWALEHIQRRAAGAIRNDRFDPALENLKKVLKRELPVLIHTAGSEGITNPARLWGVGLGARAVISHGCFDAWKAAPAVIEWGVPVNLGPRAIDFGPSRNGRINGIAAEYLQAGAKMLSLNTDSSVVPQEEFFLQGAMGARYGADSYTMLRAMTIHPAKVIGIADRVGSLEVGKDADVVVYSGDPLDPRSKVLRVWIDGEVQYEFERGRQRF